MLFSADQLVAHAIGDYICQSHWMANTKANRTLAAFWHVATYGLPFLFFRPTLTAYLVIVGSHFLIDRYRLARHLVRLKNLIAPWSEAKTAWQTADNTGYPAGTPPYLSIWLLIIADNLIHIVCNALALKYL